MLYTFPQSVEDNTSVVSHLAVMYVRNNPEEQLWAEDTLVSKREALRPGQLKLSPLSSHRGAPAPSTPAQAPGAAPTEQL